MEIYTRQLFIERIRQSQSLPEKEENKAFDLFNTGDYIIKIYN
jgi:hypothetical protein